MPPTRVNLAAAELLIYEPIGTDMWGGIGSRDVAETLAQMRGRRVTVRINSPGGDAATGVALYNQIRSHPGGATTIVEGEAASAASLVAMAGTPLRMAKGAYLMIHAPHAAVIGTADDHRRAASYLDKITDSALGIYQAHTGLDRNQLAEWMAEETWWTADEAVAAGMADEVVEHLAVAAYADRTKFPYQRMPAELLAPRRTDAEIRLELRELAAYVAEHCQE